VTVIAALIDKISEDWLYCINVKSYESHPRRVTPT
jgi:hypothetical protein